MADNGPMSPLRVTLSVLPGDFAICRLATDAPIPEWSTDAAFCSITRTKDELSIVCPEAFVPDSVSAERGGEP